MSLMSHWINIFYALALLTEATVYGATWAEWWTYRGISGPDFWGVVNTRWRLCRVGREQSPIDIQTSDLLYDPNLRQLQVSKNVINGVLVNKGQDIRFKADDVSENSVSISGGSLQYNYSVSDLVIRFGSDNNQGSEHAIDGHFFPSEIQIMAWNSEIYDNMTEALHSPNGLAIIALLVKIGDAVNAETKAIATYFDRIKYKSEQVRLTNFSLHALMPRYDEYITYEGSLTFPACQETVTWIILNKPLYFSENNIHSLRQIMVGPPEDMDTTMENNFRPIMPLNSRPVRTNINFAKTSEGCTMKRKYYYAANALAMP